MRQLRLLSVVIICILVFSGTLLMNKKNKVSTPVKQEELYYSPTGKYSLESYRLKDKSEVDGYSFKIYNKLGEVVFKSGDYFRKRDKFLLYWGDTEDVVWVYSGDTGLFYWQYSEMTNEWEKYSYTSSGSTIPEIPKQMYDKLPTIYQ